MTDKTNTPIDKLRRVIDGLDRGAHTAQRAAEAREARDVLDELASTLADASAVNDRIATILALTLLEEHVHSLRMAVEIAQRREPTQAEGDAHAYRPPSGAPDDGGDMRDECSVPAGGWTGRRCRVCRRWVWGGPTACVQCVAAEERIRDLEAQLELAGCDWSIGRKPLYDRAKAAEARVAELEAQLSARAIDDPSADCTDAAHPAWWRGQAAGTLHTCEALERVLANGHVGTFPNSPELQALATKLAAPPKALEWREPSTAPLEERVLFLGRRPGYPAFACIGERTREGGWLDEDTSNNGGMRILWDDDEVLGWLPLSALPPIPTKGETDG